MATPSPTPLKFTTSAHLSHRLLLATLTGRPLRISHIRPNSSSNPGLSPPEVSLLRLLDSLTNGSHIEFSYTGTTVLYKPGLITGGKIRHELDAGCASRGVSWWLLVVIALAPFAKNKVEVEFCGPGCVTAGVETTGDVSVDSVRTGVLPLLKSFGVERELELRVLKRANGGLGGRGGGGEVRLLMGHQVRLPRTLHILDGGKVKRVRGVAYATGVAGANNARLIEAARGVLNQFSPDTYIFSDVSSAPLVAAPERGNANAKRKTGLGFGLSLVAETNTGVLYSADANSPPQGGEVPEALGRRCALQLLEAVSQGGCASHVTAPLMLTLMAMGSEDVGRLTLGKEVLGSERVVQVARDLRAFGMSGWGLREDGDGEVVVSVVGKGVGNVGRKIA